MSWQDDMERERIYRLFVENEEAMERAWQQYQEFLREQERFTEEFKERVCEITYEYFASEPPDSDLIIRKNIGKEKLQAGIEADEQFEWYGDWIFEGTAELINLYGEDNNPPGDTLTYEKDRWPAFTEEELEQEVQSMQKEFNYRHTPEQVEDMRERFREYQTVRKYYVDFEKTLHKALIKMVVDYFPMIVHIHSNGFLEIDESLYLYMTLIKENLYKII